MDLNNRVFIVGLIGTPTIIARTANTKIIITGNGWDPSFPYFLNNFIRPDIVSYQITQAIDCIGVTAFYIFKESLQRRQIRVNI